MANAFDRIAGNTLVLPSAFITQSKIGLALGSAYVYASAGAAIGVRWIAPVSGNLTDVWFFVTASTGTPGVTTVELRNYNTSANLKPGTTLHATQTITPGTTASKWINAHFATPFSVVRGTVYWIVIGDAGWTSSNTTTVGYVGGLQTSRNLFISQFNSYTTAGGFASNGTSSATMPPMVLKFADGSVYGQPYTTSAVNTNNTLERGMKISGLTEKLVISGLNFPQGTANVSGLKIYSGATIPGGTPDLTVTFADIGNGNTGGAFFAPFTLQKNTVYRIVLTFSGNATAPNYFQIEDFATSADLTNCGFGGGTMINTIDSGSSTWTDEIDKFPYMSLIVSDQVAMRPTPTISIGI